MKNGLAVLFIWFGFVQAQSPLETAFSFITPESRTISFSNWSAIREDTQVSPADLSTVEAREGFIELIEDDHFLAFPYGNFGFKGKVDRQYYDYQSIWGWNFADLAWEATAYHPESLLYILKFNDDFAMEAITSLFVDRGFEQLEYQGVRLFSHEEDYTVDWLPMGEVYLLNTAIFPEERLLVFSDDLTTLKQALDAHFQQATLIMNEALASVVSTFDSVNAAMISTSTCRVSDGSPNLNAYSALGSAYVYRGESAQILYALGYEDAATATADLPSREKLAQEELLDGEFSGGSVQETALLITLNARNSISRYLARPPSYQFSACQ